jgi:hypothetical protein
MTTTTSDSFDVLTHLCDDITITDDCRCYEGQAPATEPIPDWINDLDLPF